MTVHTRADDPVLVGVDGSEASTQAVRWAAREAALRGTGLHVVHTWLWPLYHVPLGGSSMVAPGAGLEAEATRVLREAETTARDVAPDVPVETSLVVGEPATELLRRAPGSQLVVVGSRGLGGFTGLLLGSTSISLSAHSPTPVAVVRGTEDVQGPVVAGVDDTGAADMVLRRALEEAALHSADVLVVHSWRYGTKAHVAAPGYDLTAQAAREQSEEMVEKALARVAGDLVEVPVSVRLGESSPSADLVAASRGARLLVVGSRDLGSLRGMLLGSVTHAAVHHAACPVLVER